MARSMSSAVITKLNQHSFATEGDVIIRDFKAMLLVANASRSVCPKAQDPHGCAGGEKFFFKNDFKIERACFEFDAADRDDGALCFAENVELAVISVRSPIFKSITSLRSFFCEYLLIFRARSP